MEFNKGAALIFFPFLFAIALVFGLSAYNKNETDNSSSSVSNLSLGNSEGGICTCQASLLEKNCSDSSYPVMGGVDFVNYFTIFKYDNGSYDESQVGVIGSEEHSSTYHDYTFYFVSKTNKILFDKSPSSYIPQYGGFCTWGVAGEFCKDGYAWSRTCLGPDGSWGQWTIQYEKLYFFKGASPKLKWKTDIDTYIATGDTRWSKWFAASHRTENYYTTQCYTDGSSDGSIIGSHHRTPGESGLTRGVQTAVKHYLRALGVAV